MLQLPQTVLSLVFFHFVGVYAAKFTLVNMCTYTVWPATLSGAGTSQLPGLASGFALLPGAVSVISIPASWSGRVWARTQCSGQPGNFSCTTGDCGTGSVQCSGSGAAPPATLAEFTLNGSDGLDFYDVSLVDGYNLPMVVLPAGGSGNCTAAGCTVDLNESCPTQLRVAAEESVSGMGVACKSACEAFGDPQYCCSGAYATPDTCKPSQYSKYFKAACPGAYSYAYDDASSTFTCAQADYAITFCPTETTRGNNGSGARSPEASATSPYSPYYSSSSFIHSPHSSVIIIGLIILIVSLSLYQL